MCRIPHVECLVRWCTTWNQDCWKKPQIGRWYHPNGRKQRGTKEPLEEGEKVEWRSWLNTQHSKTKIMSSGSITSWQIDVKTMETVRDFILGGSKITSDGDCNHESKNRLLHGRKAMNNLDSILKSRDTTLPTMGHLVKAMVFPGSMYGCETWTIKKAECQRIDAFELWCWRRLLRVLGLQGDPTSQS